MRKTLLALVVGLFIVGSGHAGDGRIEISQADMASPPYVIANSGSYVLTENLTVTNAGVYGIDVQVDNVTIDLNGFSLHGPGATSFSGIYQGSSYQALTIKNGMVSGWQGRDYYGLYAAGMGNHIQGVMAVGNARGIFSGKAGIIANCTAVSNVTSGMIVGISAGNGASVSGCSIRFNQYHGIQVVRYCRVTDNVCAVNGAGTTGHGIYAPSPDNRIEGNNVTENKGYGISAAAGNLVIRNSAKGNISGQYDIGGAQYGPIVPAAGGAITNTNPWANFEF